MARNYLLLLLFLFVWAPLGCGGISQDDLRQYARNRPKDKEEQPVSDGETTISTPANPAAVTAAPVAASHNPPAQSSAAADNTGTPAGNQNSSSDSPSNNNRPNNIPAASSTSEPVTVASAGVSSANPLDSPTPKALAEATAPEKKEATPATINQEEDDKPPVITEDSTPGEIQAYHDWHNRRKLKAQAEQEAAERRADEEAKKSQTAASQENAGADTNYVSSDNHNYFDDAQALKQLFNRLTNPGNLSPDELGRVAQELAYDDATKEALLYHYGWLLTTEKIDDVKKNMAWSPALQRPLGAIHWGIGLEYSGDPRLLSNPDPINSNLFQKMGRRHNSGKMQSLVGELGDRFLLGLDYKIETGSLGSLLKPPANQKERQPTMHLKWELGPVGFSPETLGRGITLLKGGSYKELLYIANLEGIDVLAIYDMNLKQGKNGPVVNITELKLVDVARNKEIYSTPQFHNIKTKWARQDRTAKDPVEKEFENLFSFVDESLKFRPLPSNLNEENAKQRIEALAASEPANPLSVMAEMRLYQAHGQVGDAVLYAGYKVLIGDGPAKKLITGTPSERVAAIALFLPKLEAKN